MASLPRRGTRKLYLEILRKILLEEIGHGKNDFFLASSGPIRWMEVYEAFAKTLAKRGIIDHQVTLADASTLAKMAEGTGVEPEAVQVLLGGKYIFSAAIILNFILTGAIRRSLFTADDGYKIGLKPRYPAQHWLEVADDEVQLILDGLQKNKGRANMR